MKKGKVIPLTLSHKNGRTVLRSGDPVTENDVNNFDQLVKSGHIGIEEAEKAEVSELMKLKKDELQAKCDDLEIEYTQDDNKSELVARIEESEEAE